LGLLLASFFVPVDLPMVKVFPPEWRGAMLAAVFLVQAFIGLLIDSRYEKSIVWYHFWVVWYPFLYWTFSAVAAVYATPRALFRKMGQPAVWTSPDRGMFTKL
jgi:biofilm PGA synthesis N-glycosyltransferase PgaC